MKLLISGLLTVCVFVFFITSMTCAPPIMPANTTQSLYLVGYSSDLAMPRTVWNMTCFKAGPASLLKDGWINRTLSFLYVVQSGYRMKYNKNISFNIQCSDIILRLKEDASKYFGRNKESYVIRYYTNDSLILSDLMAGTSDLMSPCSLWLTFNTTNISDVPEMANRTFFTLCPNATFIGYNESDCSNFNYE
uniref:Lipocalin n=1 Tax=Rhipicephalus zambeziensis TaxID=60191 RepID=A0A224YNJ3_9ACAR